jgi:ubiquinol-cytochrome c reductase cytochrome b/c1 subunit
MFVVVCIRLGYLGAQPPEGIYVIVGRILTVLYFAYFLILLPLLAGSRRRVRCRTRSPTTCWPRRRQARAVVRGDRAAGCGRLLVGRRAECARADDSRLQPPRQKWSFSGPFGKFDRGALQRGLKVYKEVCSACHGLSYVAFRNLAESGGPGYSARRRGLRL